MMMNNYKCITPSFKVA